MIIAAVHDFERVVEQASARYKVSSESILAYTRDRRSAFIRRVIAIALRDMGYPLKAIGVAMQRNHTSILRMTTESKTRWEPQVRRFRDAAVEEAKALRDLVGQPIPVVTTPEADPQDTLHEEWLKAVQVYRDTLPHQRDQVWTSLCYRMWPHSWQKQAKQPPRL